MSAQASSPGATTTGRSARCRPPTPSDGRALWALASEVGLDLNSPYAYVLWGDRFAATSTVAVNDDGSIAGFVTGFTPPDDPDTLFVWQIGVAESARGQGIGGHMLDELLRTTGARWLEATVTPSNAPSAALFRGVAARHGTDIEEAPTYGSDLFPDGHEAEDLFRVGPLGDTTQSDTDTRM